MIWKVSESGEDSIFVHHGGSVGGDDDGGVAPRNAITSGKWRRGDCLSTFCRYCVHRVSLARSLLANHWLLVHCACVEQTSLRMRGADITAPGCCLLSLLVIIIILPPPLHIL